MKVAILIAPKDFKDETLSQLQLLFGKKDIEFQIVSLAMRTCTGYHGATAKAQVDLSGVAPGNFDALVLADGPGVDALRLYDHRPLLDTIKQFYESGKVVAGVGNGLKMVAKANIVKDAKIAKTDDDTGKLVRLYRGLIMDDMIVSDRRIISLTASDQVPEFVNMLLKL